MWKARQTIFDSSQKKIPLLTLSVLGNGHYPGSITRYCPKLIYLSTSSLKGEKVEALEIDLLYDFNR